LKCPPRDTSTSRVARTIVSMVPVNSSVDVLKAQDDKDQVISLIRSTGLSGFDLDELVIGIGDFLVR
jgi:hypothetical protein